MSKGFNDPARAYAVPPTADRLPARVRFAPADNLFDAIRLDVGPAGIADYEPLLRQYDREPLFSEIDEPWFDDETYKPE